MRKLPFLLLLLIAFNTFADSTKLEKLLASESLDASIETSNLKTKISTAKTMKSLADKGIIETSKVNYFKLSAAKKALSICKAYRSYSSKDAIELSKDALSKYVSYLESEKDVLTTEEKQALNEILTLFEAAERQKKAKNVLKNPEEIKNSNKSVVFKASWLGDKSKIYIKWSTNTDERREALGLVESKSGVVTDTFSGVIYEHGKLKIVTEKGKAYLFVATLNNEIVSWENDDINFSYNLFNGYESSNIYNKNIVIQLLFSSDRKKVIKLTSTMSSDGYTAKVVGNNDKYYRVIFGNYTSWKAAEVDLNILKTLYPKNISAEILAKRIKYESEKISDQKIIPDEYIISKSLRGKYSIRLIGTSNIKTAFDIAKEMKSEGYQISITEFKREKKKIYKVDLGAFETRKKAIEFQSDLQKKYNKYYLILNLVIKN